MDILFALFGIIFLMGVAVMVYAICYYPANRKLERKIARLKKRCDSLFNEMIEIEENGIDIADENHIKKLEERIRLTVDRMNKYIEIQKKKLSLMKVSIYLAVAAVLCGFLLVVVLK